jgi:hypothetical protein
LLHQELSFILLRSAPANFNRVLLLVAVMAAMIGLSWAVYIGPEKWLASRLKSLLAPTQDLAASVKAFVLERFAGSTLKSAIPAPVAESAVPGTASTITPSPETRMPAAGPLLTKSSNTL